MSKGGGRGNGTEVTGQGKCDRANGTGLKGYGQRGIANRAGVTGNCQRGRGNRAGVTGIGQLSCAIGARETVQCNTSNLVTDCRVRLGL
jgi:hypothetical protein